MAVQMSLLVPHLKVLLMDPLMDLLVLYLKDLLMGLQMGFQVGPLVDVQMGHLVMTFLRNLLHQGSQHQQGKALEPVPTTFARGRKFQGFACAPPQPNLSWLLSEEHSVCTDHRNSLNGILPFVFACRLT